MDINLIDTCLKRKNEKRFLFLMLTSFVMSNIAAKKTIFTDLYMCVGRTK